VQQENPEAELLVVLTKRDLWPGQRMDGFPEHVELGPHEDDLAELELRLLATVNQAEPEGDVLIANTRHAEALRRSLEALGRVQEQLQAQASGELVAYDLREALRHLGSITGEITADDLLGSIFSSFCIGK
jgi:tRNA modification GTPase